MNISDDVARSKMLSFFRARAEGKRINNDADYEKYLYKVIVQHLNIFTGDNWGEFEYLTWMAAIEYYEIKHDLPRRLSQLRFELEEKHLGFFVFENENDLKDVDRLERIKLLKSRLPVNCNAIDYVGDYEFHLHKAIEQRFGNYKPVDNDYNVDYWYDLVILYELENELPYRSGQLFCLERFVGFRKLRQKMS